MDTIHTRAHAQRPETRAAGEATHRALDDLDHTLSHGSPDSPWRETLFTLRRLLAAEVGRRPLAVAEAPRER